MAAPSGAPGAPENAVRKPFIVIGAIGIVVLVAFLALKVLGGGGGGSDDSASPSTAATVAPGAPAASTTTTSSPASPETPNQSFDVFTTKNPFQPLVASSTVSDQTTTNTSPPLDDTGGSTTATIPADQAPAAGTPVSVLEVTDATGEVTARVQVGSEVYTVKVGDTFATSYRVVSLDLASSCGQFQYGDSTFDLCAGQQTLK